MKINNIKTVLIIAIVFVILIFAPFVVAHFTPNTIEFWKSNGFTIYNWYTILLSLINIWVLWILNLRVEKSNEILNERSIRAKHQTSLVKMKNERFITFKANWEIEFNYYVNWQGDTNEEGYDNFKDMYIKFLSIEYLYDSEILENEMVKWWQDKFNELDTFYKTNRKYDVDENSAELTHNMRKLFASLANEICNPKIEKLKR